jgi:hypothetical protein
MPVNYYPAQNQWNQQPQWQYQTPMMQQYQPQYQQQWPTTGQVPQAYWSQAQPPVYMNQPTVPQYPAPQIPPNGYNQMPPRNGN